MIKSLILLITVLMVFNNLPVKNETVVTNLRCEYLRNPLGVDVAKPRFSWYIESRNRGYTQSACRILVSASPDIRKNRKGIIWDSGKISSGMNMNVEYDGPSLESGKKYYWTVTVWDQDDRQCAAAEMAFFSTGFFSQDEWKADWISAGDTLFEATLLRKTFTLEKPVEKAFVYVTGAGYYELYLNGEKVGDHVLDPAMTDYTKRILYSTFDVTKKIQKGSNTVGAMLGNGGFNAPRLENRYSRTGKVYFRRNPVFLMQMEILYRDGTTVKVTTDDSWKSSSGPVTFNHIFGGEDYDARLEKPGWCNVGYDDSGWGPVRLVNGPGGILQSQLMPPMRVTATLNPVAETHPSDSVYLFDMGQNFAGWWRIRVQGEEGLKIRVRGSETLNDSLFSAPLREGDRLSMNFKYHSQVWTDYILNGNGTEVYEPRFFYTGIRYLEVTADRPEKLRMVEAEGRVVGTDFEPTGHFSTSDTLLNRIHRINIWAQKGNNHGYPTDCPHREKGGYTGDGQVIAEAAIHDFHMAAYYRKWLNDMRDAQETSGRIPNTSPTLIGGTGGGVAWGSAYILIPWWMYQYYDDTRILTEHYPSMKAYLSYLRNLARTDSNPEEKYIINDFGGYWDSLGEWCAPGQSDCPNHPVVNTGFFFLNSMLMAEIATALGHRMDAERFAELADTIRDGFNKKFFDPVTCNYGTKETYQTYQLLALITNIVPGEFHEKVLKTVIDDITITRGGHLNTGIIGTKYLWPVLARAGRCDLAYAVAATTSYPGYGYWVMNDATTLLERWDGKNSHNHHMFGSVDEFFYKYLAGIRSPEDGTTSGGYKHISIQPYIPENLSFVNASLNTVAGHIVSSWKRDDTSLQMDIEVPSNTTATIGIPIKDISNAKVTESGTILWRNGMFYEGIPGIISGGNNGEILNVKTGSGKYRFIVTCD